MTCHVSRIVLASFASFALLLLSPHPTNAFDGHLFRRQPTVAYYVPQPVVPQLVIPAAAPPTVAYAPVITVPAAPVTAYYAPMAAAPVPVPVRAYFAPMAPAAVPAPTTAYYAAPAVAPATVVYYPVWLPRRRVSPIHGY